MQSSVLKTSAARTDVAMATPATTATTTAAPTAATTAATARQQAQ